MTVTLEQLDAARSCVEAVEASDGCIFQTAPGGDVVRRYSVALGALRDREEVEGGKLNRAVLAFLCRNGADLDRRPIAWAIAAVYAATGADRLPMDWRALASRPHSRYRRLVLRVMEVERAIEWRWGRVLDGAVLPQFVLELLPKLEVSLADLASALLERPVNQRRKGNPR